MSFLTLTSCSKMGSVTPKSDEDKTVYAIGLTLGKNLKSLDLKEKELDLLILLQGSS